MANPEVGLAQDFSEELKNYEAPEEEIAKRGDEKRGQDDSSSSLGQDDSHGPEAEIVWQYLTFETELPSPAYLFQQTTAEDSEHQTRDPAPPCPNLKKYTSPFLWKSKRKSPMVWISCIATMFTACT